MQHQRYSARRAEAASIRNAKGVESNDGTGGAEKQGDQAVAGSRAGTTSFTRCAKSQTARYALPHHSHGYARRFSGAGIGRVTSTIILSGFALKRLNNVVEQSHRNVKRRTWLAKGYGSLPTAWRTLRGIEAMEMVRKGRVRWVAKGDAVGQAKFIDKLFGVAA